MQVWAAVNEADIGKIRPGQKATFTVDAFPDERFQGTVETVRLNASMSQNVVTYTVVVSTDNSSGVLLPYLTANVEFEVAHHENVLLVPNTALRWKPAPEGADGRKKGSGLSADATVARERTGTVWVDNGGEPRRLTVKVGASDGSFTEVSADGLEEGTAVIVGVERGGEGRGSGGTNNPFASNIPCWTRRGMR